MRRRIIALWPLLLGSVWLLSLFAPLLSPGRALANRDIAVLQIPLRLSFRDLAQLGLPVWNPWLHGGQPILSNPSYGAFYPPSWLVFAAPPAYALSLIAVLHAVLAFAGAWRLARRFGCGGGAAALAGIGYVGSGAYLSLLSLFNLFCSMAWLPWVIGWGDESLRLPPGARWWRPGLLAGGALGLQLLSGEPSPAVISGLALLALTASAAFRRPAAAPRALLPFLFAAALAAAQLLPTLGRLADTPRKGLPSPVATLWSTPPARLVEIVLPRFYGDPARDVEGFFFGWNLHDRNYPFIESLYPGLLLAVLAASALLVWRIPRRAAWALCLAGGWFLALGRHNPAYEGIRRAIPVLAVLRYPEKFILLALLGLLVAGVLGWQWLLDEREAGRPQCADFPLTLALVALAAALSLTALLFWAPPAAFSFIGSHGDPFLPLSRVLALQYLRSEGRAAVATTAAVAALLGLCRWRRPSRRLLEGAAILLLAADLWHYGHGLVQTLPASAYRTPPPLAAAVLPSRDRIFVQAPREGAPEVVRRWGDSGTLYTRAQLAGLKPYTGLLWHLPYAFSTDFDLMLTGWGRQAGSILEGEVAEHQRVYRYLGSWNVGTLFLQKPFREQLAELGDPAAPPLRKVVNRYVLPRFRLVPRVVFHATHAEALAAARAEDWQVGRTEHCVRPGWTQSAGYGPAARLLAVQDEAARIAVRYRAAEGAFFVAAMTYDRQWRAFLDGKPVETYPTAACQLGVALPPGEHRLVLRYGEPRVGAGAAVSLLTLGAGAAVFFGLGRRRRMA